ncbi:endonuclease domain-containing protein [Micromonospora zhanjiangensis]|uniref:Endonuclease domain-containing protein n=1 Tax=Micromonospora zhanjiangensis TaxID=1522057 RepID=A0ABV8KL38_9ACTN
MRIPRDDASALDWLLFEQSGLLTWQQATTELTPAKVRHRLRTGRWRRLCRGLLISHTGPLTEDQYRWAAVLAAGPDAVLAGLAAARAGGLRGNWRDAPIDVLVPYHRRAADLLRRLPIGLPAVRVHRTRHLPDCDLQRGRPDRTSMARSLVDAAQWARDDDTAQAVLAAGWQQRRVTPAELRAVADRMPSLPRHRLVLRTVADLAGGAEALSELDLLRLCRRHRLPVPDLQERRVDASGRVRYLDARWRRWRLHVEIDGAHHMEVRQWAADLRRQNDIWIAGDRILRFTAFEVRRHPARVADQLRAALEAAGWHPKL